MGGGGILLSMVKYFHEAPIFSFPVSRSFGGVQQYSEPLCA